MMWGYYNPWMMVVGMFAQTLLWIAVLGALLWLGLRFVWGQRTGQLQPLRGPTASEILRQRYARGEIDAATYDDMCRRLSQSATDADPRKPTTA